MPHAATDAVAQAREPTAPSDEKHQADADGAVLQGVLGLRTAGVQRAELAGVEVVDARPDPAGTSAAAGTPGGPPRMVAAPEHFSASWDSVVTPYLSENAFVTANAFWSCADDGLPKVRPTLSPSGREVGSSSVSRSGDDAACAFSPLTLLVEEVGHRRRVLRDDLDVALLQRGLVELAVADLLDLDVVAGRGQRDVVELAERLVLAEVGRADDDVAARTALDARGEVVGRRELLRPPPWTSCGRCRPPC